MPKMNQIQYEASETLYYLSQRNEENPPLQHPVSQVVWPDQICSWDLLQLPEHPLACHGTQGSEQCWQTANSNQRLSKQS